MRYIKNILDIRVKISDRKLSGNFSQQDAIHDHRLRLDFEFAFVGEVENGQEVPGNFSGPLAFQGGAEFEGIAFVTFKPSQHVLSVSLDADSCLVFNARLWEVLGDLPAATIAIGSFLSGVGI